MKRTNSLEDDLIFAKKTDEALQRISNGVEMDFDEFIEDIKEW